jgi:hypothetical protein
MNLRAGGKHKSLISWYAAYVENSVYILEIHISSLHIEYGSFRIGALQV